jgi:hypothetical protein
MLASWAVWGVPHSAFPPWTWGPGLHAGVFFSGLPFRSRTVLPGTASIRAALGRSNEPGALMQTSGGVANISRS